MAATTGTRNVSIQVTYGQTDARNVYGMINSMRRNSSDAWYWDTNNYTKTYCNNLQPLTYDYALEQVAMKRAAEIALSYSHTRPMAQIIILLTVKTVSMREFMQRISV